jgi:hypothetical protein
MHDNDFEEFIRQEIAANRTLGSLMARIFEEENPDEARELLRQLASKWDDDDSTGSAEAFRFYRGMRDALDEEPFRWGSMVEPVANVKQRRMACLTQYRRHRQLFGLEIKLAHKVQRSAMAVESDWSGAEQYVRDAALMAKASAMLLLAEWLFRLNLPGALDVCDAAAFELFHSAYFAEA